MRKRVAQAGVNFAKKAIERGSKNNKHVDKLDKKDFASNSSEKNNGGHGNSGDFEIAMSALGIFSVGGVAALSGLFQMLDATDESKNTIEKNLYMVATPAVFIGCGILGGAVGGFGFGAVAVKKTVQGTAFAGKELVNVAKRNPTISAFGSGLALGGAAMHAAYNSNIKENLKDSWVGRLANDNEQEKDIGR